MRKITAGMLALALILTLSASAMAQEGNNPTAGLHSVALNTLGATAKGSGAPWNKDWPAQNTLLQGHGRPFGALFGAPMTGARLDIRLVIPVDIKGVELFGLDYRGTRQVAQVDIFIDGEKVKSADLPENPGKGNFVPLDAKGQVVSVVVTGEHPVRELNDGKKGPTYGGWNRVRVYSSTDVAAMMADVEEYEVEQNPAFVAPTSGTIAVGAAKVYGKPRVATEHPKTMWDKEDIAHYKQMLTKSEELRTQYEGLKAAMDERLTQPLGIPEPRQNDKGEWIHISDREVGTIHNNLGLDIANLGTVYVLSGEEKYADFAKQLLLAYADAYPKYGVGARAGFNHDPSKVFDQRLSDATWLIQVVRGYDLIYNYKGITEEERTKINDEFIRASGRFIAANRAVYSSPTNWSAISTTAILMAGRVTDDQELMDRAIWGANMGKSQGKWWEGDAQKNPSGIELHFSERAISPDGLWSEGAMGYQFMALQALIADAEIFWRMGIDLYSYRDAALKRLFDSPLEFSYPDLKTPAIHDSGHGSIVGRESYLYEYAFMRYRDPKFLMILKQTGMHLGASFQQFPVSVLYDVDLNADHDPAEWKSVNFFGVGYGILRNTSERGTVSLFMDYGPDGSHGHPDKLNIDLWAYGSRLLPDPGSIWYEQPLYRNWYYPTLSHNTLIVDELSQRRDKADHLVYGPAETFGIQRARTNLVYSGVMMDRALFVNPHYMADVFGAFARLPRTMDLAWHPSGELANTSLKLEEFSFKTPTEAGYSELENVRAAKTSDAYNLEVSNEATPIRLVAAAGPETQVIIGDGHLGMKRPPTVLQRRVTARSIWGNAIDYSAEPYVKGVKQSGSLEDGYGLLEVTTNDGVDLCYASYKPGEKKAAGLTTDAQQVYVMRGGDKIRALYLGGGTKAAIGNVSLQLAEPGLAYIEQMETGAYVVGNQSPAEATVTVALPMAAGTEVWALDKQGKRLEKLSPKTEERGTVTLTLDAVSRVEFAPAGQMSVYDHRATMLRKRMAEQQAAMEAEINAARQRTTAREAEAKKFQVPENTLVVFQAEDFAAEGNGTVGKSDKKRAIIGSSILGWNNLGHWIEWKVNVPAEGYYNLAFMYCSELDKGQRTITINGEPADPYAVPTMAATGGWANTSDDWRLYVVPNPVAERPLLLKFKQGENVLRLTNANGIGVNMDYLAIFSPDVTVTREMLAEKLTE